MHIIVLLLIIGIVIASIVWLVSARMHRANSRGFWPGVRQGLRFSRSDMPVARSTAMNICKRSKIFLGKR